MVIRCAGAFLHAARVGGRSIMTSNARGLHAAMVHFLYAKRRRAAVAFGALIARHSGRGNGRNVVGRFRHDIGVGTAMAGLASTRHDAAMVKGRRQPVGEAVVTGLARCRRGQVAGRLYGNVGISAAMAVAAPGGRDTRMRIRRFERQPRNPGLMAGIAGLGSRNMRGRLPACIDVVVTSRAATGDNPGMRKTGGLPGGCRMTRVAGLGRRNMGDVLDLGVDGNVGAVMAARTVAGCDRTGGAAVAHRRRGKSRVILVASVALRRSGDMDGRFAKSAGTVMTGRAATGGRRTRGGVIEGGGRPADRRVVAGIALSSGRNMSWGFGLRVLGSIGATVAGRALAAQPGMAHHRRRPGRVTEGMAGGTLGSRRDMRRRL